MDVYANTITKDIQDSLRKVEGEIRNEVKRRGCQSAKAMKDTELSVLSGPRHGRIYKIGGRLHQASAPGEPPAVFTGNLRSSFKDNTEILESEHAVMLHSRITTDVKYAPWLEHGRESSRVQVNSSGFTTHGTARARPFAGRIFDASLQKAVEIFRRPYK